jgi:hypothetical protein
MKKTILLSLMGLASITAFAQPVLQNSNLVIGQSFDLYTLSNVSPSTLSQTGPNITWDLSATTASLSGTAVFESMAGNPHAATYPDANFAVKMTQGTLTQYVLFKLTATSLEEIAYGVGTPGVVNLANYRTTLIFPYTYGTMAVDTYQKSTQGPKIATHHYEAYGTVLTNGATYTNLVREVVNHDGETRFKWWNASPAHPVLEGTSTNLTLWKPVTTGIEEYTTRGSLRIYPNPASQQIQVLSEKPCQNLEIYNATGQLIRNTTLSTISLEDFPPGTYFLKAYFRDGMETKTFIRE